MSSSVEYWDRIAEKYALKPIADPAAYQHKLDLTQQYLHPEMKLLEFGCGTGGTAILHAPYVKHVHAIDISAKMLEIARRNMGQLNIDNITFEQKDINQLDESAQQYDMILGLSILQLLDNWKDVIDKVHSMLKPGGLFISSTTCMADDMLWFGLVSPIMKAMGKIPNVKLFKKKDLEKAMTDAGFEIEYNWQPIGKAKAVFIIARKPG